MVEIYIVCKSVNVLIKIDLVGRDSIIMWERITILF